MVKDYREPKKNDIGALEPDHSNWSEI